MKPVLLPITANPKASFSVRHDEVPYFFKELHFHPEVEIVHIKKGSGTQYVGSCLSRFKADDLIVVGANVQHLWKCDDAYFRKNSGLLAASTVIHFRPEMFGEEFYHMPENRKLSALLNKSKAGLMIYGKTKQRIIHLMNEMPEAVSSKRLMLLLEILYELSESRQVKLLNDAIHTDVKINKSNERMNDVLQYILSRYKKKCMLHEAAAVANMSVNAFCRYFKSSTKKTFSSFVLELRLHAACKQLQETTKPVSQVCMDCGFNNLSNFNRYFKKQMGVTPFEYRKAFSD